MQCHFECSPNFIGHNETMTINFQKANHKSQINSNSQILQIPKFHHVSKIVFLSFGAYLEFAFCDLIFCLYSLNKLRLT